MAEPIELTGWRQIAGYLGVSVRTAQAYERCFGLPVHRLPGKKGRLWATSDELTAWKQRQSGQDAARLGESGGSPTDHPADSGVDDASFGLVETEAEISHQRNQPFAGHLTHALVSSALLALMLGSSILLEVAFAYNRYAGLVRMASPLLLVASMAATMLCLALDVKLTQQGKSFGLAVSVMALACSAAVNYAVIRPFLPAYPLTQATFQTWTAQAAYLKGVVYCTAFASVFLLVTFHFVIAMQKEFLDGERQAGLDLLSKPWLGVAPPGAPFLPPWVFGVLLLVGAVYSILSSAHLLEALKVTPYTNLFIQMIQIRWVLFLVLGGECCWWYYAAINEFKRDCGAAARFSSPAANT